MVPKDSRGPTKPEKYFQCAVEYVLLRIIVVFSRSCGGFL